VNADFQVRPVGPFERELLIAMYDRFDPLGEALGLPPRSAEARREWIGNVLRHSINVAAFLQAGEVIGHCFLAAAVPGTAEMAVFVHQGYRRRGVGTGLVEAALHRGGTAGLGRVWAVTSSDNEPAVRLQMSCGFRLTQSDSFVTEMEINLPVRWAAHEAFEPLRDLSLARHENLPG
jgi:RimJ/RimL family protein N-acetyltransferase